MIQFLIRRPIGVLMILLALLCLGVISSLQLPISLLPDIDIPEINVQTQCPGKSAKQIEENIVKQLRNNFQQLDNIQDIQSESKNGSARIKLRFNHKTNLNIAYIEANEQLDRAMNSLPKDIERPQIIKASASDIPAFYINIIPDSTYTSKNQNLLELSHLTEYTLKKRIEQIPEVGFVDLSGLEHPEIMIIPQKNKLHSLGFTEAKLKNALQNQHHISGNILIRNGQYQYHLNYGQDISNINDIRNLWLRNPSGKLSQIKDIAEIQKKKQLSNGQYYYNNKQSLLMAISKQADARMQDLSISVNQCLVQLRKEYPQFQFEISRDQTQLLRYSIQNLFQSLIWGIILSIVIMFIFLRQVREPLLMAISIPTSLIICMLFFYIFGISINIISLSGLVLGVGMMIDNSIIVIDNISQYLEKNLSLDSACSKGTTEVIRPLLSSALTTCSVFIPLIFLNDLSGAMFFDQAMAVCLGLLTSFLVSIFILPVIFRLLYKNKKDLNVKAKNTPFFKLQKIYNKHIHTLLLRPRQNIGITFLLIPIGIVLFIWIPKSGMPDIKQQAFIANINWNEPISIEENAKRCQDVYSSISSESKMLNIQCGQNQFTLNTENNMDINQSHFYILTNDKYPTDQLKEKIKSFILQSYPNCILEFSPPKTIFEQLFKGQQAMLSAKFYSKNNRPLSNHELQEINTILQNHNLIAKSSKHLLNEGIHLNIKSAKLLLYDIQIDQFKQKLKTVFNQNKCFDIQSGSSQFPIHIGRKESDFNKRLISEKVANKKGIYYPIKEFIDIEKVQSFNSLKADHKGIYIQFDINTQEPELSIHKIEEATKNLSQINIAWEGDWLKTQDLLKQLIYVLGISILMLFFILAAQFESVTQPLIILLEILFDISGCLFLLIIFGQSLNLMSAIGIIVVCGIIINDSILKIDAINQLRRNGTPLLEAIHIGGSRRLRPIIMTSLTTILALIPLLFSSGLGADLQKPLALAIIGGMTIGTLISIYFIPMIYYVVYRKKENRA
ncbi:MAG: efflux RND transporter permease subunit [Bacteroidales bacterium]